MGEVNEESNRHELIGSAIDDYVVTGFLGRGGMATVLRAQQSSMGRDVAIKVMPRDAQESQATLQRFEHEVRLIASLQHPHILPVYAYGQTDRYTYLVMRLVESGTLADRLAQGPLDFETAVHILDQVADALDYAHQHGVIHRDLKPGNIFLDEEGNAYLADFGLAKLLGRVDTQLTASGFVLGTPAYMSPEQITDQSIDRRVDVYALGLVLFEMLTGRQVFSGSTPASVIFKHVSEAPPLPSSVATHLTPAMDAVILRALAKSPDERQGSAGELAGEFREALWSSQQVPSMTGAALQSAPGPPAPESLSVSAQDSMPARTNRRWMVGGVALLASAGVIALVAIVLFGAYLLRDRSPAAASTPGTTPDATTIALVTETVSATPTQLDEPVATPTEPAVTPATVAEPEAASTLTPTLPSPKPTLSPTLPSATPTNIPQPPTATPTPTEVPMVRPVGRARFVTTDSPLDTVNLQLVGLELPPAGKHYEGWLVSDAGSALDIGRLSPDSNGTVDHVFTDPEGRNLAGIYHGFRASLEPDFGDAPGISQEVLLEGDLDSAVVPLVREIVLRSSDVQVRSLIEGLATEAGLGRDHLGFARDELTNGNLAGGLTHSEHTINILTGQNDPRFGDRNGDGQAQNPGDGFGVLGYLNALRAKALTAQQADPESTELALQVEFLQTLIQNTQQRVEGVLQLLERSYIQDTAESALTLNGQASGLYDELLDGLDIDGDQTVEPVDGEGGLDLLVEHAGYLANIQVYKATEP